MDEPYVLCIPAEPAQVARVRAWLRHYLHLRLEQPKMNDVQLAISEIVTNCILHGYRDGAEGVIDISAELGAECLRISVRDYGQGLAPNPTKSGAGLGIKLVGVLADAMTSRRPRDGGHEVVLQFALAPELSSRSD